MSDMELLLHHRIRRRAYELWDTGGRLDGQAEQHWLAAEREVLEQMNAHAAGSTPVSPRRQKRSGAKWVPAEERLGKFSKEPRDMSIGSSDSTSL
jgi:Protein of unknown function (DUF2934)